MSKALIIIVVAILLILGVRSFVPVVPVEQPVPAVVPVSAAEQEIDAADLGADIDQSMQEIDNDLNSL